MKERPLLFSGPMVRALLAGTKTQTRRIINMNTLHAIVRGMVHGDWIFAATQATGKCKATIAEHGAVSVLASNGKMLGVKPREFDFVCPYCDGITQLENLGNGKNQWFIRPASQSRLWVKETHLPKSSGIIYRADYGTIEAAGLGGMYGGWKPSIFCRREYSRITLEITGVRLERLQDISAADAREEGVSDYTFPITGKEKAIFARTYDYTKGVEPSRDDVALANYRGLWEYINGTGSWGANPWVWVIEFRRIEV